jgi:hypothetical protein
VNRANPWRGKTDTFQPSTAINPAFAGLKRETLFWPLVTSTRRFSESINYIKNQAGKDKREMWSAVAPRLLGQLESLENKALGLGVGSPEKILEIKPRLVRGWAKQVVTHYLYEDSLQG